jgi:hypothetical protein
MGGQTAVDMIVDAKMDGRRSLVVETLESGSSTMRRQLLPAPGLGSSRIGE